MTSDPSNILSLTRDLCRFATGVVAPENERLFERIAAELPIRLHRYASDLEHNGWVVPRLWSVERAEIRKDGRVVFDGTRDPLGVAAYSKSFRGELDWEELRPHLVTNPDLPDAYVYHCMWQYRPWAADWAMSVPHSTYRTLGPGRYTVDLATRAEPGSMIVADFEIPGRSDRTIVFNCHTCHPRMANDAFAGLAILVRLFQELRTRENEYTYRLVLGPEHLGTVFYLRERTPEELDRFVCGVYAEMPGTPFPLRVASTFPGDQPIDRAFRNAAAHTSSGARHVPWRRGAGNDETVWEAPGYEVPFVEVTRCDDPDRPYREYHTSLDTADALDAAKVEEFHQVLRRVVDALEHNAVVHRRFDGLICLSNPKYDLYFERFDPAVAKELPVDADAWGHLLNSLLRYMDGSMTILDIAERHGLPFDRLRRYLERYQEKGLIDLEFSPIARVARSRRRDRG